MNNTSTDTTKPASPEPRAMQRARALRRAHFADSGTGIDPVEHERQSVEAIVDALKKVWADEDAA